MFLEDFRDPTLVDVDSYKKNAVGLARKLFLHTGAPVKEVQEVRTAYSHLVGRLPVPAPAVLAVSSPAPVPAAPALSLAPPPAAPAVSFLPAAVSYPPPVPPAISYPPPGYPVNFAAAPTAKITKVAAKVNFSNHIQIQTQKSVPALTGRLGQEFFKEKEQVLTEAEKAERSEQRKYEALLKDQLVAKEILGEIEKPAVKSKSNEKIKEGDGVLSKLIEDGNSLQDTTVIDEAIANMERHIQDRRAGKTNVELDRFGYVIRSSEQAAERDPAVYYKSLFAGKEDTCRRKRTRSRSRSRSHYRRSRSRSRARKRRSRSRSRSRSRTRRRRRSRSRSHERTRKRARTKSPRRRSKSRPRKSKSRELRQSRSRSRSKGVDRRNKYCGPPVPAFMLHPADRLFSGQSARKKSVRKRMDMKRQNGVDDVDDEKTALDESLKLIYEMKANDKEVIEEFTFLTMEVEMLDDGCYKQFTQVGLSWEDEETGVFNRSMFHPILPTHIEQYEQNLILKNQMNLYSSLKIKYNEDEKIYKFQHVKKKLIELVSEEEALKDMLSFVKSMKSKKQIVIFTLSSETILPLFVSRLREYGLFNDFAKSIKGFCDFTSCTSNLKLNGVWKETKFSDLIDVYKHILNKSWPREERHSDGVSLLSGAVLKKMLNDYTEFLNNQELKLSYQKFLVVCGLKSLRDVVSNESQFCKERSDLHIKELELRHSDMPDEITIVTLKRFECIDVLDVDEVEEEGIKEEEYFETDGTVGTVIKDQTIKPGFVKTVELKFQDLSKANGCWSLVSKSLHFGMTIVKQEHQKKSDASKRILQARKCEISRQIVPITKRNDGSVIKVKVLNPSDSILQLAEGDDIALVQLEKEAEASNKTYTQLKEEAAVKHKKDLESIESDDDIEREAREVSEKLKGVADDIDSSEDDDEFEANSPLTLSSDSDHDRGVESPISLEDVSEDFSVEVQEEVINKIPPVTKNKTNGNNNKSDKKVDTTVDLTDSDTDSESERLKLLLYETVFNVQTVETLTEVKPGQTKVVSMAIKTRKEFKPVDLAGKVCKIITNQDFHDFEKHYSKANVTHKNQSKFANYKLITKSTRPTLRKEPKSSNMVAMVEVEIENTTSTVNHYPRGVSLGICKFIDKDAEESNENLAKKWFKCYLASSVSSIRGNSRDFLTLTIDTEGNGDLFGRQVIIKKNKNWHHVQEAEKKEIMYSCDIEEQEANVKPYQNQSSKSGKSHPSVTIKVTNITDGIVTFTGDVPLALCQVISKPDPIEVPDPLAALPLPVPLNPASAPQIISSTLDLPEPVPGKINQIKVPTEEELKNWSVKKLKICLGEAGLHQFGLKNDLVRRLFQYYQKNPSKVPKKPLTGREIVEEIIGFVLVDVTKRVKVGHSDLLTSKTLSSQKKAKSQRQELQKSKRRSGNEERQLRDQKIADVNHELIAKRIGEIKSFEKEGFQFFKTGMSIKCAECFTIGPRERKLMTFKMEELDLFSSELAGRKILIKERDNDSRILTVFKQIANIIVNDRKSEVDVLVQNDQTRDVVVKAADKEKLIRVYVERLEKDLDNQFEIPEDEDMFEKIDDLVVADPVDAITTTDIVLQPKCYHTELCTVKLPEIHELPPLAVLERTKASSMKIGMRKMILVPKAFNFIKIEDGVNASVLVRMYNAWKMPIRITKKTKIAELKLLRKNLYEETSLSVDVDQRRKYGVLNAPDILFKESMPVLLSYLEKGEKKPNIVRLVKRNNKFCVPLENELSGKKLFGHQQ